MQKKICILKTGTKLVSLSAISGNFEQWIAAGMGVNPLHCNVIDAQHANNFPPLQDIEKIVITGSGAMVTDHSRWIESAANWIKHCVDNHIPILGICFGHQLLAYALGGNVNWMERGIEVGSVKIHLSTDAREDDLFGSLPDTFYVNASHRQRVTQLPAGAVLLGNTDKDPFHAFRYGTSAWGLQFHPEFNQQIIPAYIHYFRTLLISQGEHPDTIISRTTNTPHAASLLSAFHRRITNYK